MRQELNDESKGWIFCPRFSPDGSRLATFWNNLQEGLGIWVFDLRDGRRRLVSRTVGDVLGWSLNGEWIYVLRPPGPVLAVAADGKEKPRTLVDLSAQRNLTLTHARDVAQGKTVLLGTSNESASDIWLVTGLAAKAR